MNRRLVNCSGEVSFLLNDLSRGRIYGWFLQTLLLPFVREAGVDLLLPLLVVDVGRVARVDILLRLGCICVLL